MTEELIKSKKYLDSDGLSIVVDKFKDYISDKITELYGDNIKLHKDTDSTVTEKIEEISTTIGGKYEDGEESIIDRLEGILSAYVKTIIDDPNQKELLKIKITEDENNKGNYIIALEDNGFNDYITKDIVTKLQIDSGKNEGENGLKTNNSYVNVSIDNNTGDILLSVDESVLSDTIDAINEYTINSKKISSSPVLTGADIGVNVDDKVVTIENAIGTLNDKIGALNSIIKFRGVLGPGEKIEGQIGTPGDIWIVDTKEYICIENIKDENGKEISKWELLGDVTEITDLLESHVGDFKNHKHTFSIDIDSENIDSIFTGDEDLETESTETQLVDVTYITAQDTPPTVEEADVSLSTHTHKTEVTPSGTVTSEFTGTPKSHTHTFEGNTENTENGSLSISYGLGTLTINTSHNHLYTPTGNILETEITPEGTVKSDFDGDTVEWESAMGNANQKINHVTDVGTPVTYTTVEVTGPDHTHKYTPSGEVIVKISYEGETGAPIQEIQKEQENIN